MMTETLREDPTLDEIRAAMIPEVASSAAFDGWTDQAIANAAAIRGVDPDLVRLACGTSATDMIAAWFAHIDDAMAARYPAETLAAMKIRERITALIEARIESVAPDREALRRALAILAMPQNVPLATKLAWRSADRMWRLAGDTASDFNHYTKRMTLAAVYTSTIAVFLNDESDGLAETRAFLARRIDNVMQVERFKASWRKRTEHRPSLARFVGRLRYPPR